MKWFTLLFLLCVASTCLGQGGPIKVFFYPVPAPATAIYPINGALTLEYLASDLGYVPENAINPTTEGLSVVDEVSVGLDWFLSMNAATGALAGNGDFTINGDVNFRAVDWAGTIRANMNVKLAGSVVRANGKMTMSGGGTIAEYTLDRLSLVHTFLNFNVNPATGQMAGYASLKGTAKLLGRTLPLSLPKKYLAMDLPDEDMNGKWDSEGSWKISDIVSKVNGKGEITGTAKFTSLDEHGNPYDIIEQKISGTVKNGVVSLTATGKSRSTSKIKETLTYRLSDGQMVRNKSSVSAYGQSRKF
jgi:hypothetical protein